MIGFLHPWALAGLVAAAIPLLLHLLARREPPTVVFPAVRYLITTTREHQRRLKLQHLLLLLLRTLLIVALVLAAAGPTVPSRGVAGHAPSALVLVVDNSPSSGVVVAGATRAVAAPGRGPAGAGPRHPGRRALAPRRRRRPPARRPPGAAGEVGALPVSPRRLDLGAALGLAGEVLAGESRPGEITLLTDLQASAVSAADVPVPLVVGRPDGPPPPNVGIGQLETGPQPWSADGGGSRSGWPAIRARGARSRRGLGRGRRGRRWRHVGGAAPAIPGVPAGWWAPTAELDPDELRIDDRRVGVVRVAPVARVDWDSASRFVAAACEVLESNRRIARGPR